MKKYHIGKNAEKGVVKVSGDSLALDNEMKKLEEALSFCSFGRFHIRLLLASLTGYMSASITTSTSSFILTSAECDLDLNHVQKGMIIAAPFFGQVLISFASGVLADTVGRRPCLIFGYCIMCLCCILEGSSQSFLMLLFAKFIDGMALCFCFNGVTTMIAEMTHKGLRDRLMLIGMTFSPFTQAMVVLLAWAVLPRNWNYVLWDGYFEIHSWNIYLYICAISSLLSALQFYHLPESPKYHLAHGKHIEALLSLRKIYSENTGQPMETFPITSLTDRAESLKTEQLSFKKQLAGASNGVKELFRRPLLCPLILVCTIRFLAVLGLSTLRLWYPQLSTMIEDYKYRHNETTYFCTMIDTYFKDGGQNVSLATESRVEESVCVPVLSGPETYYNSIFIYLAPVCVIVINAVVVNKVGQKMLSLISIALNIIFLSALFWCHTSLQIAGVISMSNAFNNANYHLVSSMALRIFPTTSRLLAMSIGMMSGRIGSLLGNLLLPILLNITCAVPFTAIITSMFVIGFLLCFMPNPSKENKESGDR